MRIPCLRCTSSHGHWWKKTSITGWDMPRQMKRFTCLDKLKQVGLQTLLCILIHCRATPWVSVLACDGWFQANREDHSWRKIENLCCFARHRSSFSVCTSPLCHQVLPPLIEFRSGLHYLESKLEQEPNVEFYRLAVVRGSAKRKARELNIRSFVSVEGDGRQLSKRHFLQLLGELVWLCNSRKFSPALLVFGWTTSSWRKRKIEVSLRIEWWIYSVSERIRRKEGVW